MSKPPEYGAAELKAELAKKGHTLQPDSELTKLTPPKPGEVVNLLVLDRVQDKFLPDYCTHGYASCVSCGELCWMGHESSKVLVGGEAYPICSLCAAEKIPKDKAPIRHVKDHLRKDGPHE